MLSLGGQHSRSASTVGGNPINCFKLAPRKKGAFLENGLVAPMFTGVQEGHCSLQPLGNCDCTLAAMLKQFNQKHCMLYASAYSTVRQTCGKVIRGDLKAAISSNWHHGGGLRVTQSVDGRWCSETRCCRLRDKPARAHGVKV